MVGIWVRLQDGRSIEVARKAAGDIFGEISLLTGEPRTASVVSITDAYLFEIKKEDIIIEMEGDATKIMQAERTVMNFLSRLSGIATLTNKLVNRLKPKLPLPGKLISLSVISMPSN